MIPAAQAPSLCKAYEPYFRMGAALSSWLLKDPELAEIVPWRYGPSRNLRG